MQQLQLTTLAVFILLSSGCSGAAPKSREVLFQSQQPGGTEDIFALRLLPHLGSRRQEVHGIGIWEWPLGHLRRGCRLGVRRRVVTLDTAYVDRPQWSPDGTALLLTVYPGTAGLYEEVPREYGSNLALLDLQSWRLSAVTAKQPRSDSPEIYIVRPDGTGLRRLTWNTYFDAHPSW